MPNQILQVDENMLETKLDRLVSEKVEQLLNAMLDAEADEITGAARYERSGERRGVPGRPLRAEPDREGRDHDPEGPEAQGRAVRVGGHRTISQEGGERRGGADRHVPGGSEYASGRRHQQAFVGRTHALPDVERQAQEGVRGHRTDGRNRPLTDRSYPYLFVDGVWHKRAWGGSVENVSVLVAIGVDDTGHREVIGVTEGMKEDKASWEQFIRSLIERGLKGVRLVVGDRCAGLVSTVNAMLPDAGYQRCMVHFMRNVLSRVSHKHMAWAASALKAIFAMESRESALEKAECVAAQMESTGLKAAASCLREGVGEGDHLPARRVSRRAPAADPHEQHDRTAQPGDPPQDARGRLVPRRQERAHARLRAHPLRHRQPMVHAPLPGHVPAR